VGEKQNPPLQLSFNASLKVDFQGSRVTSDGGSILVRELNTPPNSLGPALMALMANSLLSRAGEAYDARK
jgi:hypothetical protein